MPNINTYRGTNPQCFTAIAISEAYGSQTGALVGMDFYRNYLSGKSKQESLKLAQKSLRDNPEYSASEYWAAFILLDALN